MINNPSDSDDEPLDVNLQNAQDAATAFVEWSDQNSKNALGSLHNQEMQLNFGIATNKKRQLLENLKIYETKRSKTKSCSEPRVADIADSWFDQLGRPKEKPKKTRIKASDLKAELSVSSSDSEDEIMVTKTKLTSNKENQSKRRTKKGKNRKPKKEPEEKDFEKNLPKNQVEAEIDEPKLRTNADIPTEETKKRDQELRKDEQILKNRSKQRQHEERLAELLKQRAEIDREIAKQEKTLKDLEIYNDSLQKRGFSTPAKKSEKNSHVPKKKPVFSHQKPKAKVISISISSGEEDNGPIWEKKWYIGKK